MLMFGLHLLSPHSLKTLTQQHGGSRWIPSQPDDFEEHLRQQFDDVLTAHVLQQVHTAYIADPQSGN